MAAKGARPQWLPKGRVPNGRRKGKGPGCGALQGVTRCRAGRGRGRGGGAASAPPPSQA